MATIGVRGLADERANCAHAQPPLIDDCCKIVLRGAGQHIATLGSGNVVGELAPLTGGPRTATVTAKGPMQLLVIGQREFAGLLDEVPGFANRVLHNLADRMRELDEKAYG